jgi:hypothetical protein
MACGGTDRVDLMGDGSAPPAVGAGGTGTGGSGSAPPADTDGHLIVVTERESPEASLQYLHVLDGWPESGEVDYGSALELGEFVNVYALGNAVFVHQPEDATVRKLVVEADGSVSEDRTLSFAAYGVTGSGDMVYASAERAQYVDEESAQIVVWNPSTMAASWRDWDTLEYHDAAAIGVFDASAMNPELQIIEDERCASTVTTPFDGGDGFVYLVSDAALGFDALANPNRTAKALCVLRIRPGANAFDPDFFVDLKAALGSPGFYAAHPMDGGKLLVNTWARDVALEGIASPADPSWYWELPPYFEFAIVDLATGSSTPVAGIPRAAVQWSVTLRVDGGTYVQNYRADGGSDLHRVEPNGSVVHVLSNGADTDVQYLGHVGP